MSCVWEKFPQQGALQLGWQGGQRKKSLLGTPTAQKRSFDSKSFWAGLTYCSSQPRWCINRLSNIPLFVWLDPFSSLQPRWPQLNHFRWQNPPNNGFSILMEIFLAGIVRNKVKIMNRGFQTGSTQVISKELFWIPVKKWKEMSMCWQETLIQ